MSVPAKEKKESAKKRGRGRPRKAVTRIISLVVRLTPTERLRIAGKAREAGIRISDWFRRSARSATVAPRLSKEEACHLRTPPLGSRSCALDPIPPPCVPVA